MISTPETRKVAQDALDYIIANPEQHSQHTWCSDNPTLLPESTNMCGTTMCIAGTVAYVTGGVRALVEGYYYGFLNLAEGLLGLNSEESNSIFYNMNDSSAIDQLNAIAQGDEVKFNSIESTENRGDE
jgi:hypothetical protein